MLLEICADSPESIVNAELGGADRVELCSGLSVGGLTPSLGLHKAARQLASVPVFVMLRPRPGSFTYSEAELDVILNDIHFFMSQNADGFVFGANTPDGSVDKDACQAVISAAKPKPVTFHRAFDVVSNWEESMIDISQLGFSRVLSSGQSETAEQGIPVLKKMVKMSAELGTGIMVGCGLNERNLKNIMEETNAKEYHASASVEVLDSQPLHIHMGPADSCIRRTSSTKVAAMKQILSFHQLAK